MNHMPNIILITLDAFSNKIFLENIEQFPNLSKIIGEGVYFDNAFSIGPSTSFSFPGIIAGVYPFYYGQGLTHHDSSIDKILKENGYNTAFINESNALLTPFYGYGKYCDYQNHFLELSNVSMDRKFSSKFLGKENNKEVAKTKRYSRRNFLNKLKSFKEISFLMYYFNIYRFLKLKIFENTESFCQRKELYQRFTNEIEYFIRNKFRSPQFLWIHTIINHLPYFPLENNCKFNLKYIDYLNYRGLSGWANKTICKKLKELYICSLKRTDMFVGEIINTLRDEDLMGESLVVITADHGEEFMEDKFFGHAPESSSDRLLNVPLIFYYQNKFIHNVYSFPVSTIDIVPTILDIVGLKSDWFEGHSLKKFLYNTIENENIIDTFWRRPLFSEAWKIDNLFDKKPGSASSKNIFTVRKNFQKLKVVIEKIKENDLKIKFTLSNWIDENEISPRNEKYDIEDLYFLLIEHLHNEKIRINNIKYKNEKIRINNIVKELKKKQIFDKFDANFE